MSIFGFGNLYAITKKALPQGGNDRYIILLEAVALNFGQNSNKVEAKKATRQGNVTKRTATREVTRELTITSEFANWQHLQFVEDEFSSQTAGISIPVIRSAIVPVVAPFEIRDPDVVTTTGQQSAIVRAEVVDRGGWGEAGMLKRGAAGRGTVGVAAGVLTFDPIYAGAPIVYTVPAPITACETIGGAGKKTTFGGLELFFEAYGEADYPSDLWYHFPMVTRDGTPSYNFGDSPMKFEMRFGVADFPGWNKPYQIINPATAAASLVGAA